MTMTDTPSTSRPVARALAAWAGAIDAAVRSLADETAQALATADPDGTVVRLRRMGVEAPADAQDEYAKQHRYQSACWDTGTGWGDDLPRSLAGADVVVARLRADFASQLEALDDPSAAIVRAGKTLSQRVARAYLAWGDGTGAQTPTTRCAGAATRYRVAKRARRAMCRGAIAAAERVLAEVGAGA